MSQIINWIRDVIPPFIMVHNNAYIHDGEIDGSGKWQQPDRDLIFADNWWDEHNSYNDYGFYVQTNDSSNPRYHFNCSTQDSTFNLQKIKDFIEDLFSDLSLLPNSLTIIFWTQDEERDQWDWESRYSFYNLSEGN